MKRHFYHALADEARFLTVHDGVIEMTMISAVLGSVEKHDSQQAMSPEEIAINLERALEHGYLEVDESDFFESRARIEKLIREIAVEKFDPRFELMDWDELPSSLRNSFRNNPVEYLTPTLRKFCYCKDPFQSGSDIVLGFDSLGPTAQYARRNLVFKNGLNIDGNLDAGDQTSELPLYLFVEGDLHAKNIMLSGWAEVVVTGNLVVSGSIVGYDGEPGGRLKVHGNVSADNILGGYMYGMELDGRVDSKVYWLDQDEPSIKDAIVIPNELTQSRFHHESNELPIVREAYFMDSNWATGEDVVTFHFDARQSFDLLRQGKPLFR